MDLSMRVVWTYILALGLAGIASGAARAAAAEDAAAAMAAARDKLERVQRLRSLGEDDKADGLLAKAVADLDHALKADPTHAEAAYQLGKALYELGHDKLAGKALARAVALRPKDMRGRFLYGKVLIRLGRLVDAELELSRCVQSDPNNAAYLLAIGRVQEARMNYSAALKSYQEAARFSPRQAEPALCAGRVLVKLHRENDAIVQFRKAAELDPQSGEPWHHIGVIQHDRGQLPEALASFRSSLVRDPSLWQGLARCVQIHQALGQIARRDQARRALFALRDSGKYPTLNEASFFCREQFKAAGKNVLAFEYFELTGALAKRYVFFVLKGDTDRIALRISLGSYELANLLARQQGRLAKGQRLFHLDRYEGTRHDLFRVFESEPSYETVRHLVTQILEGRLQPMPAAPSTAAAPAKTAGPAAKPNPPAKPHPPTTQPTRTRHPWSSNR